MRRLTYQPNNGLLELLLGRQTSTWVGEVNRIQWEGGRLQSVRDTTCGIVPGIGLVTAADRAAWRAGEFMVPPDLDDLEGGAKRAIQIYYRRARPTGLYWRHHLVDAWGVMDGQRLALISRRSVRCVGPGDYVCEV